MKLIVGLGNPGLIYAGSRHNIGFMVVKALARSLKVALKTDRQVCALIGKTKYGQHDLVLALPQTFMNLSGVAVKALLKKLKLSPQELLVVCDDLDLELGRIKIRPHGSSAGQRGLGSIIEQLGAEEFNRLRFGIGRPRNAEDARRYVLSGFLRKEKGVVEEAKENAVACALSWVENGIIMTMDSFNTRSRNE
ncbi:MAG: aminoacyl-tRNA hydrolase [Candidatus Omnitrophica bacterium]|nr:aminoacyl-tRNA hydrolase [Candidatus Omnitrophota bacterium]